MYKFKDNDLYIKCLKILRKIYQKIFLTRNVKLISHDNSELNAKLIYDELTADKPTMIARFGAFELDTIVNYIGVTKKNKNFLQFIKGEEPDWSWNRQLIKHMNINAGFFPPTIANIEKFCILMLEDKKYVDILGSWRSNEKYIDKNMTAKKVPLKDLEPFWSKEPWSKALKGKKVVIVHPFTDTILKQYEKRELLFDNKDILPEFKSIITIKAVQSLGEEENEFKDWFEALEYMKKEIDKVDYDVCLIGAGAYGFPLAAHVKRQGKKAIHMGGALQLLFGIRGKRWEDPNYGVKEWGIQPNLYVNLINEYWVRPSLNEKPKKAKNIEGACYW